MSRKNVLQPRQIITNGDMSANVTSLTTDVSNLDRQMIQLVWTGTPVGTFAVDVSLDKGVTWSPLDFGTVPAAAGAAGNNTLRIDGPSIQKMRVRYVRTSGTGTLQAYLMASTVGA